MLFKKKNKEQNKEYLLTSFERLRNVIVASKDELLDLASILKDDRALLANFEKLSLDDANYMLTFLAGVVYALNGEVHKTGVKTFLFASGASYEDGTLKQYIIERHSNNE